MAATSSRPADHNLAAPLTSLVGRAREVAGVADTLRRTRLVTLTGPGGVGKTRVALEVARGEVSRRRDGVWMVELAAASEPQQVAEETARVLRVGARAAPLDALGRYLANRDALLVLDNCEHLVDACAELAAGLLGVCPDVRILATSRESLGVTGETVWRLDPLGPDDARRLFVERARGRRPDFAPDPAADAAIADLCGRLDRLPFAVELAAARIDVMSPAELLASLETRLDALGGEARRSPAHHRTVRAAVEWSHALLEPPEAETLRALSVFTGGFGADAAAAVAPSLTLDLLARLVDKSLVAAVESPRSRTRYRLLETVREYTFELLDAAGEVEAARDRHLRHFAGLAEVAREEWLATGRQRFVNKLDEDYENVRAALEWAAEMDPCAGMRMLVGTRDLFFRFGQADGLRLATVLLGRCPGRDRRRAEATIAAGQLATAFGEYDAARAYLAEARDLSDTLGERVLQAWTVFFEGLLATLSGDIARGRERLEAAAGLHRGLGIPTGEARATSLLGATYVMSGDAASARGLLERALSISESDGDRWGEGHASTFLGLAAEETAPDPAAASAHYRRAVESLRASNDATLLPAALIGQASTLVRRDPGAALQVAAGAASIRARTGGEFAPFYRARLDRVRDAAQAAIGADADRLWERGARLTLEETVALAFGMRRPRSAAAGVSAREMEVAALVAEGLSNKAIAARLHLSVRTVESHIRHVLAKVGLDNRTQLAGWARERIQ